MIDLKEFINNVTNIQTSYNILKEEQNSLNAQIKDLQNKITEKNEQAVTFINGTKEEQNPFRIEDNNKQREQLDNEISSLNDNLQDLLKKQAKLQENEKDLFDNYRNVVDDIISNKVQPELDRLTKQAYNRPNRLQEIPNLLDDLNKQLEEKNEQKTRWEQNGLTKTDSLYARLVDVQIPNIMNQISQLNDEMRYLQSDADEIQFDALLHLKDQLDLDHIDLSNIQDVILSIKSYDSNLISDTEAQEKAKQERLDKKFSAYKEVFKLARKKQSQDKANQDSASIDDTELKDLYDYYNENPDENNESEKVNTDDELDQESDANYFGDLFNENDEEIADDELDEQTEDNEPDENYDDLDMGDYDYEPSPDDIIFGKKLTEFQNLRDNLYDLLRSYYKMDKESQSEYKEKILNLEYIQPYLNKYFEAHPIYKNNFNPIFSLPSCIPSQSDLTPENVDEQLKNLKIISDRINGFREEYMNKTTEASVEEKSEPIQEESFDSPEEDLDYINYEDSTEERVDYTPDESESDYVEETYEEDLDEEEYIDEEDLDEDFDYEEEKVVKKSWLSRLISRIFGKKPLQLNSSDNDIENSDDEELDISYTSKKRQQILDDLHHDSTPRVNDDVAENSTDDIEEIIDENIK